MKKNCKIGLFKLQCQNYFTLVHIACAIQKLKSVSNLYHYSNSKTEEKVKTLFQTFL